MTSDPCVEPSDTDLSSAVDSVASKVGTSLSLIGPAGGESGTAWITIDQDGVQYVLKVHPDPDRAIQFDRAAATTAQLREHAYPAPRFIATGVTPSGAWALVEHLAGVAGRAITPALLYQLIALNQLQRGQSEHANEQWVSEMVDSVMRGRAGYCQVDTLLNHSSETANLMSQLRGIADGTRRLHVSSIDIVHFDFNPENILSNGDKVTGVIDWDGACTGDASFDLATMLFYCWDDMAIRETLKQEILYRSGRDALKLYLAHMILRQVDWSIRHHDSASIDLYLSRAGRIIQYLEQNH